MPKTGFSKDILFGLLAVGITFLIAQLLRLQICDHYICSLNNKVVFGALANNNLAIFINILLIVFFLVLVYYCRAWPLWIVLAGAVSNLFERIIFGGVVDYLKVLFIPVFNFADILIVAGVILFCFSLIFPNKKIPS